MALTLEEKAQRNRDAQRKYNSSHDRVNVRCEGGTADRIKALGYDSFNSFAVRAIMEKLEREEAEQQK